MLVELRLHEAQRETCREHRLDTHLAQEVRKGADVVLVSMSEDHGENLAPLQVPEVREDQIDAEMLVAREGEAGVDHDRLAGQLEHGHVLADLAEASQRDDA